MFFCWADHIFSKALECEIRKAQLQKGWNIANDLSKGRVRSWRERSLSSLLSRGWRSRCQAARASIRWISWRASQPGPTAYGPISTGLSDWREFLKLFLPGTKERYSWKLGSLGDWDLNKIFFFRYVFFFVAFLFSMESCWKWRGFLWLVFEAPQIWGHWHQESVLSTQHVQARGGSGRAGRLYSGLPCPFGLEADCDVRHWDREAESWPSIKTLSFKFEAISGVGESSIGICFISKRQVVVFLLKDQLVQHAQSQGVRKSNSKSTIPQCQQAWHVEAPGQVGVMPSSGWVNGLGIRSIVTWCIWILVPTFMIISKPKKSH